MSVQLILYPQNYEGQFTALSTPVFNQYVSNFSFNSQYSVAYNMSSATSLPLDFLESALPQNYWSLFYSTGGAYGTVTAPTISSGKITFDSVSSGTTGATGCVQKISNLQIGATYDLDITRLTAGGITTIGTGGSYTVSGVTFDTIGNYVLPTTIGTHTTQFTATNSTMVFVLAYFNNDNTNLEINAISIRENISSAPTVDVFKDGQVICDLYEESNIPLSLSVDDFKNIHEKKQSFSKPFKLPATKRNNKIFTSLFDVTKSVKDDVFSFHPYKKTKAILKENGYTIFDGYLSLIDITEKEKEISYNVNLFGDTITLADTLKDKQIDDLDLTELEHNYTISNIVASQTGSVTYLQTSTSTYRSADSVKYPAVKWNGSSSVNNNGDIQLTKLQDFFRPFVNCKYLFDRIITEAGFTYSSDFLNSTDFTKLFMDFNFGKNVPINLSNSTRSAYSYAIQNSTTSYANIATPYWDYYAQLPGGEPSYWDNTNHKLTASFNSTQLSVTYDYPIQYNVSGGDGSEILNFRWVHKDTSGNVIEEIDLINQSFSSLSFGGVVNASGFFTRILEAGETLEPQFKSATANDFRIQSGSLDVPPGTGQGNSPASSITIVHAVNALVTNSVLQSIRGKNKQWEFIKSISTMFNLVFMQDKENQTNLIIEPYEAVFLDDTQSQYITHKTLDWTSKVDISEHKSKPLKLKKNVKVRYKNDDKDYNLGIYEASTQRLYGQAEREQTDFTLLQGEEKIETLLFSATYVRPGFDNFSYDLTIPVIYEEKDGEYFAYDNRPRILFNIGQKTIDTGKIKVPAQNGVAAQDRTNFLQFSHLTETPTTASTKDYNFETIQLIGSMGNNPVDNLYNLYWFNYYDELYNPDTRVVNMKLYLTPADISNFEFYYKIRIKNREYRVNKIDYKPYELSSVEFILIG